MESINPITGTRRKPSHEKIALKYLVTLYLYCALASTLASLALSVFNHHIKIAVSKNILKISRYTYPVFFPSNHCANGQAEWAFHLTLFGGL